MSAPVSNKIFTRIPLTVTVERMLWMENEVVEQRLRNIMRPRGELVENTINVNMYSRINGNVPNKKLSVSGTVISKPVTRWCKLFTVCRC